MVKVFFPLEHAPSDSAIDEGGRLGIAWELWLNKVRELVRSSEVFTATIDPASVAANTTAEQTFTVTGLTTDMHVTVNKPTHDTGLGIVGARVSAADTVAITFMNATGSAINPGSESYTIRGERQ